VTKAWISGHSCTRGQV